MTESMAEKILIDTYGYIPEPTCGEKREHELIIDSNHFQEQQLKTDILRLAMSAKLTQDAEMGQIVLNKWNTLYPKNTYFNIDLLIGVEYES